MANNYDINYDDERFKTVEDGKQQALTDVENTYGSMIEDSDSYFNSQIEASKEWAEKQAQLQEEKTGFAIEQIEQQKEQARKDYTKEQAGAYVDWQKQSNQYGVNAEQMASGGLTNTGFSESSQVSMYNTYQNRVATARESYNVAVLNYNNAIKDAQIQNNSALAEIAYNALQTQLELSLQGFQYKNQLIIEQANKKQEVDNIYYSRYQDVLNQMNTENALAEEIRQYNESMKLQKEQFKEQKRQYEQSHALEIKKYNESIRQFNEEMARLKAKDAQEHALEIQRLQMQKQQMEQAKREAERDYQLKVQQLNQQQSQFDKEYRLKQQQYAQQQKKSSSSGSSSSSGKTIGTGVVAGGVVTATGRNSNTTKNSNIPNFNSYEKASAYLMSKGVADNTGGMIQKNEWMRRKQAGIKTPDTQYSSYSDYLNAFVDWRMSNR